MQKAIIALWLAFITVVLLFLGYTLVGMFENNNERKQLDTKLEEVRAEYTCYLDGQEIDIDTVDTDRYDLEFNDEKKLIILTSTVSSNSAPSSSGVNFIPIIY